MKLHRVAEEKIGSKVMEIIKSASIDCHLNQEGNSFYSGINLLIDSEVMKR